MPSVRKLTPAEVAALEAQAPNPRKQIAEEYDSMLAGFSAGNIVEVELDPDDDRRTVRNRFRAAARRRGLLVAFLPNREGILRFKLRPNTPPSQPPAGISYRRDRPTSSFPTRRWRR